MGNVFINIFNRCMTCKLNLCPICKLEHSKKNDEKHKIIKLVNPNFFKFFFIIHEFPIKEIYLLI